MRLLVPTLLICAAAIPAAEGLDRVVRTQEGVQRGVATQAEQAAAKADLIADDLRFNRLGDDAQADRLEQLASELAVLVRSPDAELKTMTYVVDRLSRAARGDASELGRAAAAQGELASRLDRLALNAQGRIAAANGVDDLRAAIDAQRRLLEETGKLSDQTLGKEKPDLSATERSDLERLARQQKSLEKALQETAKALREQAKAAENERDKRNLEAAADELDKGQAAKETDKAADALADNHLAEAQSAQEKALDKLEEAERKAAGATRDPLAELDKKMQDLAATQREQQRLLDETRAEQELSRAEADRLAARQQDIARDLQDQQQTAAQQPAEQARQELQQQDKAGAERAMEAALTAMEQAQRQMQQQMQQLQAEQDAQRQLTAEQQLAQLEQDAQAMQQAQDQQQQLLDQLQAQAEMSKEMAAKQQDIAQQMQQMRQTQAQQEAQQAKQALDQQNRQQAQQEMQQALQAMQQAQQRMQQQMRQAKQKMQQAKPQAQQSPGGGLEDGEKAAKRTSGWQVGLEAQDREVLSQVKADAFPARYEQALVQYYRALAGEAEQ